MTHVFIHTPAIPDGSGIVLTHGAGANCQAELLVKVADALCDAGMLVMRVDLAFRQRRPSGPPSPATGAADRAGLKEALLRLRDLVPGDLFLGGHSYGGRQASMLAAEEPGLAAGLLLLSYPLHPPDKPQQMRTAHFAALKTPALFIHGTKDAFGTPEELRSALTGIPADTQLILVEGAGHDLKKGRFDLAQIKTALLREKQRGV
jgi:predicted alpha/beta-hydrolase family hydrolase